MLTILITVMTLNSLINVEQLAGDNGRVFTLFEPLLYSNGSLKKMNKISKHCF